MKFRGSKLYYCKKCKQKFYDLVKNDTGKYTMSDIKKNRLQLFGGI